MFTTDRIKIFYIGTNGTWGYRIDGTDMEDRGYGSSHDAYESAVERMKGKSSVPS